MVWGRGRSEVKLSRLRTVRVERSLTQSELAELAGVARSTIAEIEGGRAARQSTLRALAKVLNVTTEQLQ